ncbi:tetratricopeptide repeat protein [Thalassotalea piscium]|uniref:DNA-binding winged helix-turn-helix (WHTH) protein/tetratricopeptide (TPR) repeat protein n=1 Tax=Thalassotalea piscium TaxID=1230533 RepID=A0A7X0NK83_9GAMM|nr:tetratricopeptide repeat protein [Thalassotalea piscium]MBB6544940.1 DNA-binding winged helix-turn-helix (wHTH) protein/tetratricopeptide (TPR) repeat protein [Thalassotalea piscium]
MKKSNTTPTHTKIENSQSPTFKLGPWLVNQSTNTITRDGDGECLTIEPKMMNVLVYLCQNAELTVSAEQLLIACWAGTFYGDAPVQKCIAGLRKKLGCNSRHPIYIETIHRRGYKIIAEVTFYQDQHSLVTVEDRHRWTHGSPYLGLNTFQQEHASIFFGRTKATADVIQGLKHCVEHHFHFLLILGKSGSGKSSLIRAGVLPYLQQQDGFSNIKIDNHQIISPSQSKYISPTTILIDALRTLELIKPDVDLTNLATKIEKAPELLQDALILENTGESKACISNTNNNLLDKGNASVKSYQLLVLDQFEQFLLDDNLNELEKSNLVTYINQLAYCKNLLVIAMLRNDYYANCLDVKGFLELKDHGQQYDLQTPSPFEISKMIRTPAAYAGVTFEVDKNTGEQLDELLLESAIKNPNALPLLEYTLDQLYQQRDKNNVMLLSVYYSMGGIEGAIAQQAEKTFNNMPAKVQKCWDKIMHTLVKIDTNNLHAVTARKVPLSIFTCPDQQHFIHTFLSAKLFVSILRSPRGEHRLSYSGDNINQITSRNSIELQFITIAHEALLHHWKKVNKWVDENRTAIQKREQLASDCQHWIDNNKNKDALLNSKQKLRDGLWLTTRTAIRLNNEELAFIHQSKRQHNRIKHIKNTVLFLMCCFVFTIVLQSKQVSHERDIAIQQSGRAEAISDFLTEMFSGARPHQAKGKDILVKDILALASEKLNQTNTHNLSEQPGVEASIQNIIGGIYLDLGLIAPGEQHLLRALTLYKNLSDNHSKEYLALIDNLIALYAMKFDNKKEYPLINEAIALSNQLYGEGHRRTIKYKNNLGIYYNNMGLLDKAEKIFVEVYQKRLQLFGENDKQTVESIEYLATLYYWLGQYEKAEKFYKRCLKLNRILLEKIIPIR